MHNTPCTESAFYGTSHSRASPSLRTTGIRNDRGLAPSDPGSQCGRTHELVRVPQSCMARNGKSRHSRGTLRSCAGSERSTLGSAGRSPDHCTEKASYGCYRKHHSRLPHTAITVMEHQVSHSRKNHSTDTGRDQNPVRSVGLDVHARPPNRILPEYGRRDGVQLCGSTYLLRKHPSGAHLRLGIETISREHHKACNQYHGDSHPIPRGMA